MLLLNPEAEPARQTEILDRIRKTSTDGGGSVDNVEEWGKKRLAYEIDHIRDAFYYVITLTITPAVLDEISRILRITDEAIRFMPVALKEKVAASES
ncbi:MAG: 30S ribosomal protein S6 [Thermoleophilia bacterium]